jgi:hypothetical protein
MLVADRFVPARFVPARFAQAKIVPVIVMTAMIAMVVIGAVAVLTIRSLLDTTRTRGLSAGSRRHGTVGVALGRRLVVMRVVVLTGHLTDYPCRAP